MRFIIGSITEPITGFIVRSKGRSMIESMKRTVSIEGSIYNFITGFITVSIISCIIEIV
jgi:hypothetical protein